MEVRYHILFFFSDGSAFHKAFDQGVILMMLIHIENVICRSLDHLVAFGQDHSLKDVDQLGNICHLDTVTVLIENVQINTQWILRVDADEYLSAELIKEIEQKLPFLEDEIYQNQRSLKSIHHFHWLHHRHCMQFD